MERRPKILVVDDEPDIVQALSMRLEANGYEVVTANSGTQAMSVATNEMPDAIILDIGMPGGDGHVVARHLRNLTKTCTIPILYVTGRTSETDYSIARHQGVCKYITKPYHPEDILEALKEALSTARAINSFPDAEARVQAAEADGCSRGREPQRPYPERTAR